MSRVKIKPDFVTMTEAVAGGIPLSLVAGKKEIMDLITTGKVNRLGTLNGNSISVAVGLARKAGLARAAGLARIDRWSLISSYPTGMFLRISHSWSAYFGVFY